VTTKPVEEDLKEDLDGVAHSFAHYGDITGSNALSDANVGCVLGTRHYGDQYPELAAALNGEQAEREGHGTGLTYNSPTADAALAHMRRDETMQAILRFGRDRAGAVVFAHTACLSEDLPVVGQGSVVNSYSETARAVHQAAREAAIGPGGQQQEFTRADVEAALPDGVEIGSRQVRRLLAELTDDGHLQQHDTGPGVAAEYELDESDSSSEDGTADLEAAPDAGPEADPGQEPLEYLYTWNVRVDSRSETATPPASPSRPPGEARMPAPDTLRGAAPPG
jgi:hypothetical protein